MVGCVDWNAAAGEEAALFIGVTVDGVVEKIAADAAVVEQRVSFAGRAVAGDGLAVSLGLDEERQQGTFHFGDFFGEADIA